jgi:hypothetical protein
MNEHTLSQTRGILMELAKKLRVLSDETFFLEHQIARVIANVYEIEGKLPAGNGSKIIPFPAQRDEKSS